MVCCMQPDSVSCIRRCCRTAALGWRSACRARMKTLQETPTADTQWQLWGSASALPRMLASRYSPEPNLDSNFFQDDGKRCSASCATVLGITKSATRIMFACIGITSGSAHKTVCPRNKAPRQYNAACEAESGGFGGRGHTMHVCLSELEKHCFLCFVSGGRGA